MTTHGTTGPITVAMGLILLFALAGCSRLNVESSPDTFPIPESTASALRGGQAIAVENFYKGPTIVQVSEVGAGVDADLHQYTQTAITLLEREFRKQGIDIGPGSKTVTLKVFNVTYHYGWTIGYKLNLSAELKGAGTVIVPAENNSPATAYRAIDGTIMRAVTRLLLEQQFETYINE
jgi:hypothetical protein